MSREGITKQGRQREFEDQLKECDSVNQVVKDSNEPDVLRVYCDSSTKLVWTYYSEDFNWWGGSESKRERLQSYSVPLLHAFLGRNSDEYYLVPDDELTETRFNFGYQDKDGSTHRKIRSNHGTPPNSEILEGYTNLCSQFE